MIKSVFFAIMFVFASFSSFSWGPTGHRVVGAVADAHLSKKAKKQIKLILGNESIAISSNWADFIKSDSTKKYLDPWHYLNVKAGLNETEFDNFLENDKGIDVYTKTIFLINELKNRGLSLETKQFYLRLLIHFIGDLHQPMHVSRVEDQGGNRIKVMWFNEPTNLHALWDDKLIEFQKLSYSEYAQNIDHADNVQAIQWQKDKMSKWFFESYQISANLYKGITQPDQKLGFRYNYDHIDTLNRRLLQGGLRLAGVLNEIFK